MKRIFLFIDSLVAGGAQRQFVGLAYLLSKKGYNIMTATYYDHPFYKSFLDENNIPHECFDINSKLSLPKLVSEIKHFNADILISFLTIPNSLACIAAKICGVKLIVSERNTHLSVSLQDRIIFNLYRFADYVVPNSYSETRFIEKKFPFLKKTVTITNFVDLKRFHPTEVSKNKKRRLIMTAASIRNSKNTKSYIEACIKAIDMGCKANFVWYGVNDKNSDLPENVKYTNECIKMVEEKGLANRIKLLPKRKDIEKAYQEADIFCLPSHFEGTPNVICEAIASGLPIMASNICDNPNFVIPGRNGWLFNQNDIDDMASKILKASGADCILLEKYGKESRIIAVEKCSEAMFVDKYIKLIESL